METRKIWLPKAYFKDLKPADQPRLGEAEEGMAERRLQQRRQVIPAREARQGEIIQRTPLRRGIFIAGLVGAVSIAMLPTVWSYL